MSPIVFATVSKGLFLGISEGIDGGVRLYAAPVLSDSSMRAWV